MVRVNALRGHFHATCSGTTRDRLGLGTNTGESMGAHRGRVIGRIGVGNCAVWTICLQFVHKLGNL